MSTALVRAKEKIAQVRKSALAQRAKREAAQKVDIVVGAVAGAVIGHFERQGKRIPKLINVALPAKAQWAIVAAVASDRMAQGEMRTRVRQGAIAMATLAGYESAVAGKLVEGR